MCCVVASHGKSLLSVNCDFRNKKELSVYFKLNCKNLFLDLVLYVGICHNVIAISAIS